MKHSLVSKAPLVSALLIVAILTGACAGGRVRVVDVEEAFARDYEALDLRVPTRDDLDPARAADPAEAMRRTEALAREYLAARGRRDDRRNDYVRSLLACCLLAQGRTVEAKAAIDPLDPDTGGDLARERALASATRSLVGACRAIDARRALARMAAGELEVAAFVRHFGSLAGIQVPSPDAPGYDGMLAEAVTRLRGQCLPYNDEPGEAERAARGRADIRRLIGEQIYNEAAALLSVLPPPNPRREGAVERWLAGGGIGLFIVYARVLPDLLPTRLSEAQKQWQLEQVQPLYLRVKAMGAHLLPKDERLRIAPEAQPRATPTRDEYYRHLYALLLDAEIAATAWISTR